MTLVRPYPELARALASAGLPGSMSFRTQLHAHTKVVATIGPASEPVIGELIDAGLSVARINFSHGTPTTTAGACRRCAGRPRRARP